MVDERTPSPVRTGGDPPRLLLVGTGDLGAKVAMLAAHALPDCHIRIMGRNGDAALRLANMCRLSALQCGLTRTVDHVAADLEQALEVEEAVLSFRPDLVFTSASIQPWHAITQLPPELHARIANAGYGPWLPMHLAPVYSLMAALRGTGHHVDVINAAFPDAVHPSLAPLGLSPAAGIGNVANYIPGLSTLVACDAGVNVSSVRLRFMAHHFVSFSVSKSGATRGAPFHLSIHIDGVDVSDQYDASVLFRRLAVEQPRTSGRAGQYMTAASAMSIIQPLVNSSNAFAHSPGFEGRVGGWPIAIADRTLKLDLPETVTEADIESVNRKGQVFDGIDSIGADGTVFFSEPSVDVMREELGYDCPSLHASDAWDRARELRAKFLELEARAASRFI